MRKVAGPRWWQHELITGKQKREKNKQKKAAEIQRNVDRLIDRLNNPHRQSYPKVACPHCTVKGSVYKYFPPPESGFRKNMKCTNCDMWWSL